MEPTSLVFMLVVASCQEHSLYDVYDEAAAMFDYSTTLYGLDINDFKIYCVEVDDLTHDNYQGNAVLSWADTPNAINVYVFRDRYFDKSFRSADQHLSDQDLESYALGIAYDHTAKILKKNTKAHDGCIPKGIYEYCTLYKVQIRMQYWKECPYSCDTLPTATDVNVWSLAHEFSHSILKILGYPESIAIEWVHSNAAHAWFELAGKQYYVMAPYNIAEDPPWNYNTAK